MSDADARCLIACCLLVLEVPHAGEDHRHAAASAAAIAHRPHGAAGLDDGGDACCSGRLDAVGKGKNASEAHTAPRPRSPARSVAMCTQSTRFGCPPPNPHRKRCPREYIALDFT